jgi:CTP:phosphocholine cytidylyltransferase-like protein
MEICNFRKYRFSRVELVCKISNHLIGVSIFEHSFSCNIKISFFYTSYRSRKQNLEIDAIWQERIKQLIVTIDSLYDHCCVFNYESIVLLTLLPKLDFSKCSLHSYAFKTNMNVHNRIIFDFYH